MLYRFVLYASLFIISYIDMYLFDQCICAYLNVCKREDYFVYIDFHFVSLLHCTSQLSRSSLHKYIYLQQDLCALYNIHLDFIYYCSLDLINQIFVLWEMFYNSSSINYTDLSRIQFYKPFCIQVFMISVVLIIINPQLV